MDDTELEIQAYTFLPAKKIISMVAKRYLHSQVNDAIARAWWEIFKSGKPITMDCCIQFRAALMVYASQFGKAKVAREQHRLMSQEIERMEKNIYLTSKMTHLLAMDELDRLRAAVETKKKNG